MLKKNKKGTDKILSLYWIVILTLIAGAIVAMVSLFYGYPQDVRGVEANLMINQVSGCISNSGELNENLFNKDGSFETSFSLLKECNLNFNVEKSLYSKYGNYYLEVNFYNVTNGKKLLNLSEGNPSFKADCKIENKDYEKLAKCVNRTFYSVDNAGNPYSINILSIINKVDKNVK